MENGEKLSQRFASVVGAYEFDLKMAQAISNHQLGNILIAADAYRQVLAVNNQHLTALNNLSLLSEAETAISLLQKALSVDQDYLDALINISVRLLVRGEPQKAQPYVARAKVLAPEDVRVTQLVSHLSVDLPTTQYSMNKSPKYSVIMPTHHRAVLLARAISSLKAQLNASTLLEIIVVSDCVDAQTDEICRQWLSSSDIYIRRSGAPGPSASRNLALQMAQGQFILFLDDDDAWHPQLLEALEACVPLQQGQAVYFNCSIVKERREITGPEFLSEVFVDMQDRLTEDVFVKNQVHMSCFAFPRHVLQGLTFDTHMRAYEDWDYLLSVFSRQMPAHVPFLGSKIYEVDDSTTDRRGSSIPAKDQNAVMDYLYTYRRHKVGAALQEKRAQLLASTGLLLSTSLL